MVDLIIRNADVSTPPKESRPALIIWGREQRTEVSMDNAKVKIRYALGRTNHGPDGGYGTSKFHVNPYFATVTAIQMSNRRQWIVEIQSN